MIKITHVITGLGVGGAEMMLYKLLQRLDGDRFESNVISLQEVGPVGDRIRELGIPVNSCLVKPGLPDPTAIFRLARMLKRDKPHIVQTWMYHADLLGGLATKIAGQTRLVWNIQHSDLDPAVIKRSTILIGRINAKLSKTVPDKIICCSEAGLRAHKAMGYSGRIMEMIPNGIDPAVFVKDTLLRKDMRDELGVPEGGILIGHVARFHPMKDHRLLVAAAELLAANHQNVYFVLCGTNVDWENEALAGWIRSAGLSDRFRLLGRRDDLSRVYSGLDVMTLCSKSGEGCPNVVVEAMSCETPCVVTDVGDCAEMVGDTGLIVKHGDEGGLHRAWVGLLALSSFERVELGRKARLRASELYNIDSVVAKYEEAYRTLIST